MPDETVRPSFKDAFSSAVKEHSPVVEPASPDLIETSIDEPDDTKPESTQATEPPELVADQPAISTEPAESFLTPDEVNKLTPEQQMVHKRMNRAYTAKTQALSAERKSIEQYQQLIHAFETNPTETLKTLAKHYGLPVTEAPAVAEAQVQSMTDSVLTELRESLGPELSFLADKLTPAFDKLARHISESVISAKVKPIEEAQQQQIAETAAKQTEAVLSNFTAKHPGWNKHEAKMAEIGQKLTPNGMDEVEYLETLYALATAKEQSAAMTKAVVDQINKAAASSESIESGVSASRVASNPPKLPTFAQAWDAAKKGERFVS